MAGVEEEGGSSEKRPCWCGEENSGDIVVVCVLLLGLLIRGGRDGKCKQGPQTCLPAHNMLCSYLPSHWCCEEREPS